MANEDLILKMSMFEQETRRIEEQINLINQQIVEMKNLNENLEEIEKGKEKEILANLGRGIFIKSEIKEKKLFVNIGSNIVLRKNCKETQEIAEKQINQLNEMKNIQVEELSKMNFHLNSILQEARKQEKDSENCKCVEEKGKKCEHCECEED